MLAVAFGKYASALKDIHFKPGSVPDAATLDEAAEALDVDQPGRGHDGQHAHLCLGAEELLTQLNVSAAVVPHAAAADDEELPAWSLPKLAANRIAIDNPLPERVDRDWALGGATGKGVKVCVLDSGVELTIRSVGPLAGASRSRSTRTAIRSRQRTRKAICAVTARRAQA